jgi:hypothetical protein
MGTHFGSSIGKPASIVRHVRGHRPSGCMSPSIKFWNEPAAFPVSVIMDSTVVAVFCGPFHYFLMIDVKFQQKIGSAQILGYGALPSTSH